MHRIHRALVSATGAALAAAGTAAPPTGNGEQVSAAREALRVAIGDGACSEPAQCRTVAIGHQACGGPETWLAWSGAAGNGAQIETLAARHVAARRAQVERLGLQSTCAVVIDPGAECRAGRCVLSGGAGTR
jgi:hypothetical protein